MPELDELFKEDVRATAPRPRDEFLERMERRVEAGFPKQRRRRFPGLDALAPAFAALMIVVAIGLPIALIAGGGSSGDDDAGSGGLVDAMTSEESGGGDESAGSSAAAPPLPEASVAPEDSAMFKSESGPDQTLTRDRAAGGSDQAPGRTSRLVERRNALTLSTSADDFDDTTAEVLRVADTTGSIVQTSNVSERDNRGVATFDLRVPASRLDDVLRDLSRLGKVTERTASSDDITGTYVSARNRLEDARDTRRALLRALERADSGNEADALRARIADARRRIAAAERDIRRTRARADRARVAVTVESTGEISEEGSAWTPGDAASDAWRVLEVIVGVALIALAVIAPFAVLAVMALMLRRLLRRRQREAALG
jgi:hypothetical protein